LVSPTSFSNIFPEELFQIFLTFISSFGRILNSSKSLPLKGPTQVSFDGGKILFENQSSKK